MRKDVTAGSLEKALLSLGFVAIAVHSSHRTYRHASSGAMVVLPWQRRNETLSPANLVSVKRTLSEAGVLDRDSFDSLLEKAA